MGKDVVIGVVVGGLSGAGSFAFLRSLEWATTQRLRHDALRWLLPLAGLVVGWVYLRFGGAANRGTNHVLDEVHEPTDAGPPLRMAPLVLLGATATHLFGGSGGREGAAVQIAAGLTKPMRRFLSTTSDRRALIVAAIGGGFGSVFGVPAAGTVFALEVPTAGRQRYEHVGAALAASYTGDRVARALGIRHEGPIDLRFPSTISATLRVVVAAVGFGLLAAAFIELTGWVKRALAGRVSFAPARLAVGGIFVLILTSVAGTKAYIGLSLPLIDAALAGSAIVATAFIWKLVFTAVTIGSGFPGGEVTPLFCMGACLGSVLAEPLGLQRAPLAALGMIATFAAASRTPIACAVMGLELFTGLPPALLLAATFAATLTSGNRSVYGAQRAETF